MHILHLMSGSIACAKASALVSAWAKRGHEVRVACTRSVRHFVGHATLEGFSGHPVLEDVFAPGQVMDHIELARWAEIVVAAPATSNLVNKLAAGIADDAPTALWQAAWGRGRPGIPSIPMVIVPAMNSHMWNYPATRASVERLRGWGVHVLPTSEGDLACGDQGEGRMLEPDEILRRIETLCAPRTERTRRVLVTAGGTREPIDAVRFIGNLSSGRTAAALADALAARGHAVTWLGAESAVRPEAAGSIETYVTYADLAAQLQRLLAGGAFDAVVHAAAVSDFALERVEREGAPLPAGRSKIPSGSPLSLHLRPNPKLLAQMRNWSGRPDILVIGFKLTDGADPSQRAQAVAALFAQAAVDAVAHNDLDDLHDGRHPFTIHGPGQQAVACEDVNALALHIARLLESRG